MVIRPRKMGTAKSAMGKTPTPIGIAIAIPTAVVHTQIISFFLSESLIIVFKRASSS
jgi:hypothetical protein